jgi:hypothetical protein
VAEEKNSWLEGIKAVARLPLGIGGYAECVDCGGVVTEEESLICSVCLSGPRCRDCMDAHEDHDDQGATP